MTSSRHEVSTMNTEQKNIVAVRRDYNSPETIRRRPISSVCSTISRSTPRPRCIHQNTSRRMPRSSHHLGSFGSYYCGAELHSAGCTSGQPRSPWFVKTACLRRTQRSRCCGHCGHMIPNSRPSPCSLRCPTGNNREQQR